MMERVHIADSALDITERNRKIMTALSTSSEATLLTAEDLLRLTAADSLDGAPVLPGFAYPLSELFAP